MIEEVKNFTQFSKESLNAKLDSIAKEYQVSILQLCEFDSTIIIVLEIVGITPMGNLELAINICGDKIHCRYNGENTRKRDNEVKKLKEKSICVAFSRYGICEYGKACRFSHF